MARAANTKLFYTDGSCGVSLYIWHHDGKSGSLLSARSRTTNRAFGLLRARICGFIMGFIVDFVLSLSFLFTFTKPMSSSLRAAKASVTDAPRLGYI
jgi:hypothetical protein